MSDQSLLETNIESGPSVEYWDQVVSHMHSAEVKWSYYRNVYSIVAIQLLFTTVVGAAVISCHPLVTFLTATRTGVACYVLIILCPIIALWPLYYYTERHPVERIEYTEWADPPTGSPTSHPVNYVLLGIFTFGFSFAVGASCAFTSARVILEALILTSAMAVSLTLSSFWFGKIAYKHYAFLSCGAGIITVVFVTTLIQVFFPLVNIGLVICASLYAIIFSAYAFIYINFTMFNYAPNEYIWAGMDVAFYVGFYRLYAFIVIARRGRG